MAAQREGGTERGLSGPLSPSYYLPSHFSSILYFSLCYGYEEDGRGGGALERRGEGVCSPFCYFTVSPPAEQTKQTDRRDNLQSDAVLPCSLLHESYIIITIVSGNGRLRFVRLHRYTIICCAICCTWRTELHDHVHVASPLNIPEDAVLSGLQGSANVCSISAVYLLVLTVIC